MRNISVATFIHILFSMAITILIATFLLFLSWDKDRQKIAEYKRYQLISVSFLSNLGHMQDKEHLVKLYNELQVAPILTTDRDNTKEKIEKSGKTIFTGGSQLGQVKVFLIEEKHYIYIQRMGYNLMLFDKKVKNRNFEIAVSLGIFLIVFLILVYLAILDKLNPLGVLYREIENFAQGDMSTRVSYVYDDEIGEIAKSFDNAIVHINELSTSKNLFMRNLMHELKTPITKGRIVAEMIEDNSIKNILIRAFERMDELISELAQIERVTMQGFQPYLEYVSISELIEKSQSLLMSDKGYFKFKIQKGAIYTDKKLMIIAIKNLLDNALKYGSSKVVTVEANDVSIDIISYGKPLEHSLSHYIEPFYQKEKRSSGFGLGLYIVHSIVEKLNYTFEYEYKESKNIFSIKIAESIV